MKTKHSTDCTRVWGRLDPSASCPRCQELKAGAEPRKGWASGKANDARHLAEVRAHRCAESNCGTVCTFGEW